MWYRGGIDPQVNRILFIYFAFYEPWFFFFFYSRCWPIIYLNLRTSPSKSCLFSWGGGGGSSWSRQSVSGRLRARSSSWMCGGSRCASRRRLNSSAPLHNLQRWFHFTARHRRESVSSFCLLPRNVNAGRPHVHGRVIPPPHPPLLWPCPLERRLKRHPQSAAEGAPLPRWPLRLKCFGQNRSGCCRCPALYVQEKVGTAAAAAAMATVGRVTDLETMGRQHGLSLNLLSCNLGSPTVSRGLYCWRNFDTVTDDCLVGPWCSSPPSLITCYTGEGQRYSADSC